MLPLLNNELQRLLHPQLQPGWGCAVWMGEALVQGLSVVLCGVQGSPLLLGGHLVLPAATAVPHGTAEGGCCSCSATVGWAMGEDGFPCSLAAGTRVKEAVKALF